MSKKTSGKLKLFIEENVFLILLSIRTLSACFNLIWDCDETYNYIEPLHFVLFGNGFQTWEYSPQFSLRSYLYIYLHAAPIYLFKNLISKITLFYLLRFILAIVSSYAESTLFKALLCKGKEDSSYAKLGWYYLILSMTNVGMFLSATTFLPSTFSMYLTMLAYGAWLNRSGSPLAIFSVGLAVLLGWPFAALLGIPIFIESCLIPSLNYLNKTISFIRFTILFGVLISVPMIAFDSYLFGRFVIAPLNIVLYNVFPSNPNVGPDIYGREPLSFYLINCLLNFNILFPLCMLSFVLMVIDYLIYKRSSNIRLQMSLFGLLLWLAVFFTRPHKEERFLYPIYPLVLLSSSVGLCLTEKIFYKLKSCAKILSMLVIVGHFVLSLSRGLALINNYSGSVDIYHILNQPQIKFSLMQLESKRDVNVCVGKEWYRFPGSFFLPEDVELGVTRQEWRLRFLESNFKGQLPGRFEENKGLLNSTRFVDTLFNDENKEVTERYVKINECNFIIDTDNEDDDGSDKLFFNKDGIKWRTMAKLPFLDSDASDRLSRALYIPFFSSLKNKFTFFKIRAKVL